MKDSRNIIIGCMTWGIWGKQMSIKAQSDFIQFYIEQGNSRFDHADIYGDYTAENEFGQAFAKCGVERTKIHLTSKCGIQLVGENRSNKVKHYQLDKDYIIRSAEESLRQLRTDYLDTFLLHRPSPLMHPHEIAEAISHLLKSGKIRQFGVSNFTPSQIDLLTSSIDIKVNQIEYSLTHNNAIHDGSLDQMQKQHISAQAWSPLGTYFKENNQQNRRIKSTLTAMANKYDAEETSILLAWILKHPANISPVIGTTQPERVMEANKALSLDLELEDWFLLLEASMGHEVD